MFLALLLSAACVLVGHERPNRNYVVMLRSGEQIDGNSLRVTPTLVSISEEEEWPRSEVEWIAQARRESLTKHGEGRASFSIDGKLQFGEVLAFDSDLQYLVYNDDKSTAVSIIDLQGAGLVWICFPENQEKPPTADKKAIRSLKKGVATLFKVGECRRAIDISESYLQLLGKDPAVTKLAQQLQRQHTKQVKREFSIGTTSLRMQEFRGSVLLSTLTYQLQSRAPKFKNLDCRVWLQLESGAIFQRSFSYYTVESAPFHLDSVAVPAPMAEEHGEAVRFRIELRYDGTLGATSTGGTEGEHNWWEQELSEGQLLTWKLEYEAYSNLYSGTLGKKGIDP